MRVIYEISLEDMRGILAEKYEIDAAKIEFMGHGDLVFARIDVSETETPGQTIKEEDPRKAVIDINAENRYKEITDELLKDYIKQGYTIPAIVKIHGLEDDRRFSARLYKRAEAFRTEGARQRGRRHQEETQTTEQGGDGSRMEVLPVPGMPQGV